MTSWAHFLPVSVWIVTWEDWRSRVPEASWSCSGSSPSAWPSWRTAAGRWRTKWTQASLCLWRNQSTCHWPEIMGAIWYFLNETIERFYLLRVGCVIFRTPIRHNEGFVSKTKCASINSAVPVPGFLLKLVGVWNKATWAGIGRVGGDRRQVETGATGLCPAPAR